VGDSFKLHSAFSNELLMIHTVIQDWVTPCTR